MWHNIVEYGVDSNSTESADAKKAGEKVRNANRDGYKGKGHDARTDKGMEYRDDVERHTDETRAQD